MADLDQLLRGDLAGVAANDATVPDFASLERRGIRRRRTRSAAVGLLTSAAAVAVGLAALHGGTSDRGTPPVTPTTPTPSPSVVELTADEIVDDPESRAVAVVVAPDDPRVRAVVWRLCRNERCSRMRQAVALTSDGFRTRATVVLDDVPTYVGEGVFSFGFGNPRLLRTDGTVIDITGLLSEARPLADGEVAVSYGSGVLRLVGVDPRTGAGHPVPVPEDLAAVQRLGPGTRLTSHVFASTDYVWSDDGGATWGSTPLDTGGNSLTVQAASVDTTVAVLEGGDGATLFPLQAVHRSLDGGATFERIPLFDEPMAYGQNAGVLPDGRLLLNIEAWSDDPPGGGHRRPVGLHVSTGTDWSDLRVVEAAAPYADDQPDVFATGDGLLVVHPQHGVASTDAGQTWQTFRLR
ncbi:MAG TPA: sialidase family protein [Nocardioidaceae bacterium]|nr:sialidase family protein [Nocardioidaceae bacterium]